MFQLLGTKYTLFVYVNVLFTSPVGNIFSVQVSSPNTAFSLEHALLYCIGVNLPTHKVGQLDRVLVLASPINDVNLHAWNLNRVTRFMVLEAGIQMELCSACMGHRRNIITFLVSPRIKNACMTFLLKEMRIPDQPEQFTENGPIYYKVTHYCKASPPAPPPRPPIYTPRSSTSPSPELPIYYNEAEKVVLEDAPYSAVPPTQFLTHSYPQSNPLPELQAQHAWDVHDFGEVFETQSVAEQTSILPPPLPPRTLARPNYEKNTPASLHAQPYLECHTTVSQRQTPIRSEEIDQSFFTTPYQISHRIYITDSGQVKREPHIFGSGGGVVRRRNKPPVPPRQIVRLTPPRAGQTMSATQGDPPASHPPVLPAKKRRPEVRTRRSWSESRVYGSGGSQHYFRRSSGLNTLEEDKNTCSTQPVSSDYPPPPPLPPKPHTQAQAHDNENGCLPHPLSPPQELCDISMVTQLTVLHPPPIPPKSLPQPKPRSRTLMPRKVTHLDAARQVLSAPPESAKPSTAQPRKPPVPLPRKKVSAQGEPATEYRGSHSANSSPVLQRRQQQILMERSLSSGSLGSDDYKSVTCVL